MCRSLLPDWTGGEQGDGLNYLRLPERQSKISSRKQTKHDISSCLEIPLQGNTYNSELYSSSGAVTAPFTESVMH